MSSFAVPLIEKKVGALLACSRRSDSGERCKVKGARKNKSEGGGEVREGGSRTSLPSPPLLFIAFFTSHRSPLSERLEQARALFQRPF